MSNNQFSASIVVPPTFTVRPGAANNGIISRLNTSTKFVVTADNSDGRLDVDEPITVKNSINDVAPIRLTQLIDVNTANISDGAILVYNGTNQFFEATILNGFENLFVSNTITINALSANGSLGTAGQILISNGTSVYWGEQLALPDVFDAGFY